MALDRIAHRVAVGGHDIDEGAVLRRYRASLGNLSRALDLCDEATILDNTVEFVALARWSAGVLSWVGDVAKHGALVHERRARQRAVEGVTPPPHMLHSKRRLRKRVSSGVSGWSKRRAAAPYSRSRPP